MDAVMPAITPVTQTARLGLRPLILAAAAVRPETAVTPKPATILINLAVTQALLTGVRFTAPVMATAAVTALSLLVIPDAAEEVVLLVEAAAAEPAFLMIAQAAEAPAITMFISAAAMDGSFMATLLARKHHAFLSTMDAEPQMPAQPAENKKQNSFVKHQT